MPNTIRITSYNVCYTKLLRFRSGIEAVPTATVEAAEALGYSRLKAYMHIVLPLAFRVALPALNNNLVNLIKTTTIAYAIARNNFV